MASAIAASPALMALSRPCSSGQHTHAAVPAFSGLASASTIRQVSPTARHAPALPRLRSRARVRCAAGDVSAEGTQYLIAGAVAIGILGSAFPLLFSRKDLCPVCDGSGFVRSGSRLAGNAGRKDDDRIVCPNCQGLGKVNQTDKK